MVSANIDAKLEVESNLDKSLVLRHNFEPNLWNEESKSNFLLDFTCK